jgi:type IV pilus assembly protein PilM
MLELLKKRTFPTGVDLGSGYIRMAQLEKSQDGLCLISAAYEAKPADIEAGSADWQRWAAKAAKNIVHREKFKGKQVITALPSDDIFIDQIKVPNTTDDKITELITSKVKKKLPFSPEGALIKHIRTDLSDKHGNEIDVLVLAAEKERVNRHLAIYEKAGLEIRGIGVWPLAMINSYTNFFGRRDEEQHSIVMLMDIGSNHCNIVISRHEALLFARVIPIGFNQLAQGEMVQRLMAEVDACCRYFESVSNGSRIERLMFLAGRNTDKNICAKVAELAQKMQIPAQIGDVLAAVRMKYGSEVTVDRRDCQVNWATAFGLSLNGIQDN